QRRQPPRHGRPRFAARLRRAAVAAPALAAHEPERLLADGPGDDPPAGRRHACLIRNSASTFRGPPGFVGAWTNAIPSTPATWAGRHPPPTPCGRSRPATGGGGHGR